MLVSASRADDISGMAKAENDLNIAYFSKMAAARPARLPTALKLTMGLLWGVES